MIRANRHNPLLCLPWRTWRLGGLILFFISASASGQLRGLATQHYQIHTDLDQRLAEDLATRMEAMYTEYSVRLSDFNPPVKSSLDVYLFTRKQDYSALTKEALPNTGGIFMERRNLLAAFLEGQGRDSLRRTLQHEAFHQFAFSTIGTGLPVWLNEGIAQVFEEGIWTGRQFMIGQVPPRRLRQLQLDIRERRFMPFREFLTMSNEEWRKGLADPLTGASRYSQAWAMTHFLIFANDENDQPRYRSRLITFLKMIHNGGKAEDAFPLAFSDNYDGFQQRFLEYIRTLPATREATIMEQQTILADMLIMLNAQQLRFDDVDSFRKAITENGYRLRYTKGAVQWSTETDPAIYLRDVQGRSMNREQFFFSPRSGAPLPDMVCRPMDGMQFRTIFHNGKEKPDHETIIETR